ncbi:FIG00415333: hypothetical protein [Bacteroides ovatus]|jgi:hypothetical protein|nr:FIG00415333: hypothetical protein [Bacteroides ovatus]
MGLHSFDKGYVFPISCLLTLNFLPFNTKLPVFISVFPLCFKKNTYLCHALSTHQRDEIGGKRFYF